MTDKGKELMKETVENLKKLDKESMILVKASIDILIARQKMDEKMMMGMTEIKPSRIALRYLLRAIALKKGWPFSMMAMSCSMQCS